MAFGPDNRIQRFTGCMVNGYRFHTHSRENGRQTQNSGIVVKGEHGNNVIDFYGMLQDIFEVQYLGDNKKTLIFECDWYKVDDVRGLQVDKECGIISVNFSKKWYQDQPYILASQANQVFYVPDIKLGTNWYIVQSFSPRTLFDVPESLVTSQCEDVLQEQVPVLNLVVDLNMDVQSLSRGTHTLQLVDSSIVHKDSNRASSQKNIRPDQGFIDDDTVECESHPSSESDEELLVNDDSDSD